MAASAYTTPSSKTQTEAVLRYCLSAPLRHLSCVTPFAAHCSPTGSHYRALMDAEASPPLLLRYCLRDYFAETTETNFLSFNLPVKVGRLILINLTTPALAAYNV